jgi:hypothetical protein
MLLFEVNSLENYFKIDLGFYKNMKIYEYL